MKKIIITSTILILLVLLGVGGYYLWQYLSKETPDTNKPAQSTSPLYSSAPNPSLPPQSNNNTDDPLVLLGGPEIADYYLKNGSAVAVALDGQVVSIRGKGKVPLSPATLNESILKITPSFDGKYFIEKWGSNNNPRFSLYNTEANTWTQLSEAFFTDIDFSPAESKLIYVEQVTGKVNLGIIDLTKTNKDGSFVRSLIDSLSIRDVGITWVSPDVILISDKPAADVPGSIWKYTLSNKKFDLLVSGQAGLWVSWNKTGSSGIKFSRSPQNKLEAINLKNETLFTSRFLSFPDKCVISSDYMYCASPKIIPANKKLPDDYLKRSFYTLDYFYKYNIKTGEEKLLFTPDASVNIDARNLKIEGDALYFINRYDDKLYQLNLGAL